MYLWTLTLKNWNEPERAKQKWNYFLTQSRWSFAGLCGLRVVEMQETCGLHVHFLVREYFPVKIVRAIAEKTGWGRGTCPENSG